MNRDLASIADIIRAHQRTVEYLAGISKEAFEASGLIQAAVIRQLEIVGEATKRLSMEFRAAHPAVPWSDMAGMRDRLIHAYDNLDLNRIWDAAANQLPTIGAYLQGLLPPDE